MYTNSEVTVNTRSNPSYTEFRFIEALKISPEFRKLQVLPFIIPVIGVYISTSPPSPLGKESDRMYSPIKLEQDRKSSRSASRDAK